MVSEVRGKMERILSGQLKYTSSNLALNMLIMRLQRKLSEDPDSMASCILEVDDFAAKFPIIANTDFDKIAVL